MSVSVKHQAQADVNQKRDSTLRSASDVNVSDQMWWMDDIIVPAVLILGIYCSVWLVRSETRAANRKNTPPYRREHVPPLRRPGQKAAEVRSGARRHVAGRRGLQDALTKRSAPPSKTAARAARPMPSPIAKPQSPGANLGAARTITGATDADEQMQG